MEADQIHIRRMLERRQQFRIPIYQRRYSWRVTECKKLLDGIAKAAEGTDDCFIGTMVNVSVSVGPDKNPVYVVIDGQQRMTTVMLILAALKKALDSAGNTSVAEQVGDCIYNRYAGGEEKYKLVSVAEDKTTLECIMENREIPTECSIALKTNYEFITNDVEKKGLEVVWAGMQRLTAVNILLNPDDRPQRVFESINSTALPLENSDLIRNYVLMDLQEERQNEIYERQWRPLEELFKKRRLSDDFVRDFLTIKTRSAVRTSDIYEKFKAWMSDQDKVEVALKEITKYAEYFARLEYWEDADNEELRNELEHIDRLGMDVMRPLLMQAMSLQSEKVISEVELGSILQAVESYVFRRSVCGLTSAGLNKSVPVLLTKMAEFQSDHAEGIKAALESQRDGLRFPDDKEFRHHFTKSRMYRTKAAKYALFRLENHQRVRSKDHPPLAFDGDWSIEHIMPRNTSAWEPTIETEVASEYVDRIGNLTVTGYNSELSNRPFLEKRKMEGGYDASPYLLNKNVSKYDTWGIDEIEQRSELLGEIAIELWKRGKTAIPSDIEGSGRRGDVKVTEEDYFQGDRTPKEIPKDTMRLFEYAKNTILRTIPSLEYSPRMIYLGFENNGRISCTLEVQKRRLRITFNAKKGELEENRLIRHLAKPDGKISGHYGRGEYAAWIITEEDILEVLPHVKKVAEMK